MGDSNIWIKVSLLRVHLMVFDLCVVCIHTTMYQTYNTIYISNSLFPIFFSSVLCVINLLYFLTFKGVGWTCT